MAQAAEVIAFPRKKLTFKAEKIDLRKVMDRYDGYRDHVAFALSLLLKTPSKLKRGFARVEAAANEGHDGIRSDSFDNLICEIETMAGDFASLADLLETTLARLVAVQRNLI